MRSNSRNHTRKGAGSSERMDDNHQRYGRNSAMSDKSRGSSANRPSQYQISRAQSTFDKMKLELENKDRLIDQNI